MIKEYRQKCECGRVSRFVTFKAKGLNMGDHLIPIETEAIDIPSFQMYFRDKIHKKENLVLQDNYKDVPVYRSLTWNSNSKMYQDVQNQHISYATEFLSEICYGLWKELKLVEVFG